jgi:hypothetical protein
MKYSPLTRLRCAWRAFVQRFRRPLTRLRSYNRMPGDHAHICLAARLLEEDDFRYYCPKNGTVLPEIDDACDRCEYMRTVFFYEKEGFCHDAETETRDCGNSQNIDSPS